MLMDERAVILAPSESLVVFREPNSAAATANGYRDIVTFFWYEGTGEGIK